jgi:hypothetical protein
MNVHSTIASRRPELAPWWMYAVVIVPANLGKEQLLPLTPPGGFGAL